MIKDEFINKIQYDIEHSFDEKEKEAAIFVAASAREGIHLAVAGDEKSILVALSRLVEEVSEKLERPPMELCSIIMGTIMMKQNLDPIVDSLKERIQGENQ